MATTTKITLRPGLQVAVEPGSAGVTGALNLRPVAAIGELDLIAGECDWSIEKEITLAASGTTDIDFYDFDGDTTPTGDAIAAANVIGFYWYLQVGANTDGVTFAPSVSNGWTAPLGANGSTKIIASTTTGASWQMQTHGGYAVTDASDHLVTITNLSGTESAVLQLMAYGDS